MAQYMLLKTRSHKAYHKTNHAVFLHYPHSYDNQTVINIIVIVFRVV